MVVGKKVKSSSQGEEERVRNKMLTETWMGRKWKEAEAENSNRSNMRGKEQ